MRIDHLHLENFKMFEKLELDLHPNFTLLVGENGTGKTSVLDALAVALGVWLVEPYDSTLSNSGRPIFPEEIHLKSLQGEDRPQFREFRPVRVAVRGEIAGEKLEWERRIPEEGKKIQTKNDKAKDALKKIDDLHKRLKNGEKVLYPVIAYYGAGRTWLASNERKKGTVKGDMTRKAYAFYDCLNERIRFPELREWFEREKDAAEGEGKNRASFDIVLAAVRKSIPRAEKIRYGFVNFERRRKDVLITIEGKEQPLGDLSAGQRMMFALVADIAIKITTQNNYLVAKDIVQKDEQEGNWPRVLRETPGVVLIDEIDAHLHPQWQRTAIDVLRSVFPAIQFIITSHSPFIIQATAASGGDVIRILDCKKMEVDPLKNSIEDIVEEVQGIEVPQQSARAHKLTKATERYFTLLQPNAKPTELELEEARRDFREANEPFSNNPGVTTILKIEAQERIRNIKQNNKTL
jgi:predicted ATP-binding protein involved in virulence